LAGSKCESLRAGGTALTVSGCICYRERSPERREAIT
jgi:hypothetical protein